MAKQKDKTIADINNRQLNLTIKPVARIWQRRKMFCFLVKLKIYKLYKQIRPVVKIDSNFNEFIQKYNGKNLPTKHNLKLKAEMEDDKTVITVFKRGINEQL